MKPKQSPSAVPITVGKAPSGESLHPTLVFALVVGPILFFAITFSVGGPRCTTEAAKDSAARTELSVLQTALNLYAAENGSYPDPLDGLNALVVQPAGKTNWQPHMELIPKDPWNHNFVYRVPDKAQPKIYDLRSMGPDGMVDTADDILAPHAISPDP